jgi:hypothetical protein
MSRFYAGVLSAPLPALPEMEALGGFTSRAGSGTRDALRWMHV